LKIKIKKETYEVHWKTFLLLSLIISQFAPILVITDYSKRTIYYLCYAFVRERQCMQVYRCNAFLNFKFVYKVFFILYLLSVSSFKTNTYTFIIGTIRFGHFGAVRLLEYKLYHLFLFWRKYLVCLAINFKKVDRLTAYGQKRNTYIKYAPIWFLEMDCIIYFFKCSADDSLTSTLLQIIILHISYINQTSHSAVPTWLQFLLSYLQYRYLPSSFVRYWQNVSPCSTFILVPKVNKELYE